MRVALMALLGAFVLGVWSEMDAGAQPDAQKELNRFHGTWTFQSVQTGGKELADQFKDMTVVFEGDKYTVKKGNQVIQVATQKLDPSKSPRWLDAVVVEGVNKGSAVVGIYEVDADTLKVCFDPEGKKRPTEFKASSGAQTLIVHKRKKT